ncbi:MAG: ATPase [Cycloclasticus sp. symbiont of Poecilosclerida sp. M]|nr:MAG: ATPase [Cycloclasticus sp. symbiont of Poecilosclerida sp. M]
MANNPINSKNYLIPAGIFIGLLISLYIMSQATQADSQFNDLFTSLIVLNLLGALFLFGLLVANIGWLWRQYKKQAMGYKITARVVALFLAISVIPTGIVFYFSNQLLHQSIDSWFDVQVDDVMKNALELGKRSLDDRTLTRFKETRSIANRLSNESDIFLSLTLADIRERTNATELTALSKRGEIIATTNLDPGVLIPNIPDSAIFSNIRQYGEYIGLEPKDGEGLVIRAVVEIRNSNPKRYLQAIYAVPEELSLLATSVETAYASYKELNYLQQSLKFSFSVTLSLVLGFSLLAASWAAFIFARQLVAPIRQLVKGTQALAKGDYEKKLKVTRKDELGFLVTSFNDMTVRISDAKKSAEAAQRATEDQHAELETILSHLSNGVLSFNLKCQLETANQGAENILGVALSECTQLGFGEIANTYPATSGLMQLLSEKLPIKDNGWEAGYTYQADHLRKTLLLSGLPLLSADKSITGYVVVFDDVTPIIQSQRNAAWGEVAQRLAHEIKNPLTPIQLSAERLQRKLKGQLDNDCELILEKSITTIVQQVDAMKSMVNDFSEYARPPQTRPQSLSIGSLLEDILMLYQGQIASDDINISSSLASIHADSVRMRQVLINLIKNAQEATANTENGYIKVTAKNINNDKTVEICIADNGPGVDNSQLEQIFEPYVTSKEKGTGLGLAIVKKIIEEHGGSIHVKASEVGGAIFVIQLPALLEQTN